MLNASGMDMKAGNGEADVAGADFTRITRMLNGAMNGKGIKEYGSAEQTLMVKTDRVGLSIQLPDEEPKKGAKGQ